MGWPRKFRDLFFEKIDQSHSIASPDSGAGSPWTAGYLIKNRYEIRAVTTSDQYVVYTARDRAAKKTVSITTLPDNVVGNSRAVRDFLDGADEWVTLGHQTNIVSADFVDTFDGRPLIFSEYIDTTDLGECLNSFSIEKTLDFAIQFCTGMEYAHEKRGAFHGGIRPSSVMVQKNPAFQYGYSYRIRNFYLAQSSRPNPGEFSIDDGTLLFIPPELFPHNIKEDFSFHYSASLQSDIYSFGVILYIMATGKKPFFGVDEVFTGYPVSPKIVNPDVPESLNKLIAKCMKRRSEERYGSFREVKSDLIIIYRERTGEEYSAFGRKDAWAGNDRDIGQDISLEPEFSDEIVAAFECSVLLEPENFEVLTRKGDFLVELSRLDDAIAAYTRALEVSPGDARTWNKKGVVLARRGRFKDAVAAYTRLLELIPSDARAWNNKGVLLAKLGRFEEAVTAYTRALEISPADAKIWNNKGDALAELGRFDDAVAAFLHISSVNPEDMDAWYAAGDSMTLPGRFETVIPGEVPSLNSCIEGESRPREAEKWYCEGVSLARRGKFEEAVSAYDHAITLRPDYADAWLNKGTAYGILGKDLDAVHCFGKFVDLAPPESASQVRDLEELICEMKP